MSQWEDDARLLGEDMGSDQQPHDKFHFDVGSPRRESAAAWLVSIDGAEHWLPKSQCSLVNGVAYVPRWLCEAKNINTDDQDPF